MGGNKEVISTGAETIFDKILRGEIPCDKVYEDEKVLAFRDINPQAPIHILVIPKKKAVQFADLKDRDENEVGVLFKAASKIAAENGLESDGYRVVINNGRFGQQSVDYIHIHLLGGRQLNWPPG